MRYIVPHFPGHLHANCLYRAKGFLSGSGRSDSAKTGEGVEEVFEAAARLTMSPNEKLKKIRSFRRLFGKD
jgi:hypothetical protein